LISSFGLISVIFGFDLASSSEFLQLAETGRKMGAEKIDNGDCSFFCAHRSASLSDAIRALSSA
jgi:hypothetical protein